MHSSSAVAPPPRLQLRPNALIPPAVNAVEWDPEEFVFTLQAHDISETVIHVASSVSHEARVVAVAGKDEDKADVSSEVSVSDTSAAPDGRFAVADSVQRSEDEESGAESELPGVGAAAATVLRLICERAAEALRRYAEARHDAGEVQRLRFGEGGSLA